MRLRRKLKSLTGLDYVEGYGMSETIAGTHINPPHRPKPQCLGIPVFDVDSRVIDPVTLQELPQGETGEIVVNAPQVMQGYWRNPKATAGGVYRTRRQAFSAHRRSRSYRRRRLLLHDGSSEAHDQRVGYKVWPAEVEALMYRHPAIHEVCVIGVKDDKRGETVKALVVPDAAHAGEISEQQIIDWAHEQMASYKAPRIVEFVDVAAEVGQRQDTVAQIAGGGCGPHAAACGNGTWRRRRIAMTLARSITG